MDYKTLRRWLKDNGYQLTVSGKTHFFVYRGETRLGTLACSPSDNTRGILNDISALRRNGVPIPHKGKRR